jgi:hypothetical protein
MTQQFSTKKLGKKKQAMVSLNCLHFQARLALKYN